MLKSRQINKDSVYTASCSIAMWVADPIRRINPGSGHPQVAKKTVKYTPGTGGSQTHHSQPIIPVDVQTHRGHIQRTERVLLSTNDLT